MFGGFRSQTDLFDLDLGLRFASFAFLLRPLVQELSVIEHPTHWGNGVGGHFDQVEIGFLSDLERFLDWHNPNVIAVGANQANLTCSNGSINFIV